MAELILPNSFVNGTKPEAAPHAENFEVIEDFVNGELLLADGSVAMTGPLRVPNPQDAHDLVNKQYADALGTPASTPNTIARRSSVGLFGVGLNPPSEDSHPATKAYVDSAVSGYSSSWTTLTLLNGCTNASGWTSLRVRKVDGVVFLNGAVNIPSLTNAPLHVATLPSGYRPPGSIVCGDGGWGQTGDFWVYVASNGQIRIAYSNGNFIDYVNPWTIQAVFPAA